MDSPLLPTIRRPADATSSPSAFLADLSLADAGSPSSSFAQPPPIHQFRSQPIPQPSFASGSGSSSRPWNGGTGNEEVGYGEETPQKAKPKAKSGSKPRFSLFAQPSQRSIPSSLERQSDPAIVEHEEEEEDVDEGERDGVERGQEEDETIYPKSQQTKYERDDKLRESLYELRQMNQVFDGFLTSLEAARDHNERLAVRVKETSTLLDMYTELLGQTEHHQALIQNRQWTGAQDDAVALEAEVQARIAAEEAAEEERLRAEEEARAAEEVREAQAREAALRESAVPRGGIRGRGGVRVPSRGSGIRPPSRQTSNPTRPPSSSGTAPSGIRKPSAGLNGKYADVKSSGYGPRK